MKRTRTSDSESAPQRSRSSSSLPKGVVHLPFFISAAEGHNLLVQALELGVATRGGFFKCNNERTKNMKMMNLGRRTDCSGDCDQAIPEEWRAVALRALAAAQETEPSLPSMTPNVCVVNMYSTRSRLSPHVDVPTRREPGTPIVSISLGLSADFVLQRSWGKKQKAHKVSPMLAGFFK